MTSEISLGHLRKPLCFSVFPLGVVSLEAPDQTGKAVGAKQSLDALMSCGVWHVLSHLTDQSSWHEAPSHPNLFTFQRASSPPSQYHCLLACLCSLVVIFCMCNKFLYPKADMKIIKVAMIRISRSAYKFSPNS